MSVRFSRARLMTEEAFFAIDMAYTNRDDTMFTFIYGRCISIIAHNIITRAPKL
jgi:hypothetical protein